MPKVVKILHIDYDPTAGGYVMPDSVVAVLDTIAVYDNETAIATVVCDE